MLLFMVSRQGKPAPQLIRNEPHSTTAARLIGDTRAGRELQQIFRPEGVDLCRATAIPSHTRVTHATLKSCALSSAQVAPKDSAHFAVSFLLYYIRYLQ